MAIFATNFQYFRTKLCIRTTAIREQYLKMPATNYISGITEMKIQVVQYSLFSVGDTIDLTYR